MVDPEFLSGSLKSIFIPPVRISVDSPTSCSSKNEHLLMTPQSAQSAASFSVAFDSLQQQDAPLRRRLTAEVGRYVRRVANHHHSLPQQQHPLQNQPWVFTSEAVICHIHSES
jgi:hypothetical protein